MSEYYQQEDVVEYWNKRYEIWDVELTEEAKYAHFKGKDAWFEERFSHILPQINTGGSVLDLGCGNAQYSVPLKRRFSRYQGIDTSRKAIEIARRYFRVGGWDASRYNGRDIPFFDDWFDCVVSITVLQHQPIENRLRLIEEVKRVLKPDGIYIGLEWVDKTTAAFDMPNMDTQIWIDAWKPWVIVPDVPPVAEWVNDHVWVARMST